MQAYAVRYYVETAEEGRQYRTRQMTYHDSDLALNDAKTREMPRLCLLLPCCLCGLLCLLFRNIPSLPAGLHWGKDLAG